MNIWISESSRHSFWSLLTTKRPKLSKTLVLTVRTSQSLRNHHTSRNWNSQTSWASKPQKNTSTSETSDPSKIPKSSDPPNIGTSQTFKSESQKHLNLQIPSCMGTLLFPLNLQTSQMDNTPKTSKRLNFLNPYCTSDMKKTHRVTCGIPSDLVWIQTRPYFEHFNDLNKE